MKAHINNAYALDLPYPRKLLLIYIALNANRSGKCTLGMDELAEACRISKRQVMRHKRALEDAGLLRTITNREHGKRAENSYQLGDILCDIQGDTIMSHREGPQSDTAMSPSNGFQGDIQMSHSFPLNNPPEEGGSSSISKDIDSSPPEEAASPAREKDPIALYEKNFTKDGYISPMMVDILRDTMHDVGPDVLYDALAETLKSGGRTFRYTETILRRWKLEGRRNGHGLRGTVPKAGNKRTVGADFSKTRELANRKRRARSVPPDSNAS